MDLLDCSGRAGKLCGQAVRASVQPVRVFRGDLVHLDLLIQHMLALYLESCTLGREAGSPLLFRLSCFKADSPLGTCITEQ